MSIIRQSAQDGLYVFALLCVLFIPFPFHMFPFNLADLVFGKLIVFISGLMPGLKVLNPSVSSDSASMYLLMLILILLALTGTIILAKLNVWKANREKILPLFRKLFAFYLALQLLKYGFDKVFKGQFYLPEPNTLYTPLGQVSKDLLFWSAIGTSYLYSLFTGIIEIIAAVCLMFRRSRVLGLMIAVPLLLQVLVLNLGFDISVKLFSAFLLFLSLLLLWPQLGRLYNFIVLHEIQTLKREDHTFSVFNHVFISVSLKTFVVGLIFLEAIYPVFRSGNLNDDHAERPYLHGAYEVFGSTNDVINRDIHRARFKRFFIHRDGYMIFQDQQDRMYDFKLGIDSIKQVFILRDYQQRQYMIPYQWDASGKVMTLNYFFDESYDLKARALDWRKLPALQKQFHWTVDSYGRDQ